MRPLFVGILLLLVGSLFGSDFPAAAFSFIGVPQKIREGSYQAVEGEMQSLIVKVIKVEKGTYDKPEIGFYFEAGTKPPLDIGEIYFFEAVYDRHGIRYTHWEKNKKRLGKNTPVRAKGD